VCRVQGRIMCMWKCVSVPLHSSRCSIRCHVCSCSSPPVLEGARLPCITSPSLQRDLQASCLRRIVRLPCLSWIVGLPCLNRLARLSRSCWFVGLPRPNRLAQCPCLGRGGTPGGAPKGEVLSCLVDSVVNKKLQLIPERVCNGVGLL
jgi:hypothetical protein